jgi:hypothetical protein
MKAIEAGADQQQQPRSPGVAKPPPNNATSYTPPSAEINFNNNNNASAIANIHGHANSEIYNGDTPVRRMEKGRKEEMGAGEW